MTNMDHIVNWYSYEHDHRGWLDYSETPFKSVYRVDQAKNYWADAENSNEACVQIEWSKDHHEETEDDAEKYACDSVLYECWLQLQPSPIVKRGLVSLQTGATTLVESHHHFLNFLVQLLLLD